MMKKEEVTANTIHEVKEVLPNTACEVDGVLSTIVGFFDNVVLYPIKKANITFQYRLEEFRQNLEQKASEIPTDKIQEPPITIVGPTLEALKYSLDDEALREMYINLLCSSMDSSNNNYVHPAFVDIIRHMSSYDARLFKFIAEENWYIKAINPRAKIAGTTTECQCMPEWYIDYHPEDGDVFRTSASILCLANLGLIDLYRERGFDKISYDQLVIIINKFTDMQYGYLTDAA